MTTVRPTWTWVFFLAIAAAGSAPLDAADVGGREGAPPTFGGEVQLVTVDVVVTDPDGLPIGGLSPADFLLTEDAKPQTIVSFETVTPPPAPATGSPGRTFVSSNDGAGTRRARTFAVVFDDTHLTPLEARRARDAVRTFLDEAVSEDDQVLLVSSSGGAWRDAEMPAGRGELLLALDQLAGRHEIDEALVRGRVLDYEAQQIVEHHDFMVCQRVARRLQAMGLMPDLTADEDVQRPNGLCDPLVESRAQEVFQRAMARARVTLQTIRRVCEALGAAPGRKSLILVSQGFVYDPLIGAFREAIEAARAGNVAIYNLDARGLDLGDSTLKADAKLSGLAADAGDVRLDEARGGEGPETLARSTGGFDIKNTNDLAGGIARIANESRVYYLLGYNPSNARRDGRFRRIEVKVGRRDVVVRARKGYYAPGAQPAAEAAAPDAGAAAPELRRAIDAPSELDGIALRMASYVLGEGSPGTTRVVIAADIDITRLAFEERGGRSVDALDVFLGVVQRESGQLTESSEQVAMTLTRATREAVAWHPVAKIFELAPGPYRAKLVVRDHNSRRVGSVVHRFEVPEPTGLRLATPVLSDTLAPARAPGAKPEPRLLARRDFPVTENLYCQIEVFGAAENGKDGRPRVAQGYRVVRSDGVEVRRREPQLIQPTAAKQLTRLFGFPLGDLGPGEYELILSIQDELSGQTRERREGFRVVSDPDPSGATGRPPGIPRRRPGHSGGGLLTRGPRRQAPRRHRQRVVVRRHGRIVGRADVPHQIGDLDGLAAGEAVVGGDPGQDRVGAGTLVRRAQILVRLALPREEVAQQDGVAAAVTADPAPQVDLVGRPAEREDARHGPLALDRSLHRAVAAEVELLLDLVLETPLRPVEGDHIALPGVEGVDRVAEGRAAVVGHEHVHRVLDVDLGTEDALIAVVPVVLLVVEIETLEVGVVREAQEEAAALLLRAGVAALVVAGEAHASGHLRRVELALARGVDGDRNGREPPVDEIEVVGGLVDHQAAREALLAVPAPEVVRSVQRVEHPVEVHREHVADGAAHEQLLDLCTGRRVAVVERHGAAAPGTSLGLDDGLALLGVDGHGLLGDDVLALFHGAADVLMVVAIDRGDDHDVGTRLGQHAIEVGGIVDRRLGPPRLPRVLLRQAQTAQVDVTAADQLRVRAEGLVDRLLVHARPGAHADDRVACLGARAGPRPTTRPDGHADASGQRRGRELAARDLLRRLDSLGHGTSSVGRGSAASPV